MFSTVPSKSLKTIWSSILNGSVKRIRIPAKKFCKMSRKAKPIATPLMPSSWTKSPALNVGMTMDKATNKPIRITVPWANRPSTIPKFRACRCLRVRRLTSNFSHLAAKKNSAKTINANTMFGSMTIKVSIIPWIFCHAADIDAWKFITPPNSKDILNNSKN